MLHAVAIALAMASTIAWAESIELGGFAGTTSTTMTQSFDCPPPSSPTDVCVTSSTANEERQGLMLGIHARYALMKHVIAHAGLAYVQKGYAVTQPTFRIGYLEVPIVLRIDPLPTKLPVRVFGEAGVAPAVRVRCTRSGREFTVGAYSAACDDDPGFTPMHTPRHFDFGVVIGGGVGWRFSFGTIELAVRRVRGVIDTGAWGEGGKTVNVANGVMLGFARPVRW